MIPFAKDRITISRVPGSEDVDGYDPVTTHNAQVATNIRATIGLPSAAPNLVGGDRIVTNATMQCDPCDIQPNDVITDAQGTVWTVLTVVPQVGFGLDHYTVALRLVTGAGAA